MKNKMSSNNPLINDFIKLISTIRGGDIFNDFLKISALTLYNCMLKNKELAEEIKAILNHYTEEDKKTFNDLLDILIKALTEEKQDFLGKVFQQLGKGNGSLGQIFTPSHISELMAKLTYPTKEEVEKEIAEKGYIYAVDLCGGGGALMIGLIKHLNDIGINYQKDLIVEVGDLDERCFYMLFIQMTLLGVPAIIRNGNTLTGNYVKIWHTFMYYANYQTYLAIDNCKKAFNILNEVLAIDDKKAVVKENLTTEKPLNVEPLNVKPSFIIEPNGQMSFNF